MLVKFIRIFIGLIFVFSSVSKAIEIENFSFLLMSYGYKNLMFFAPFITGLEFFIGLSFILGFQKKWFLRISLLFTLILLAVFLYGYIYLNISDCGCFGTLVQMKPSITIVKSIVLLGMIFLIYRKGNIRDENFKNLFISASIGLIVFAVNSIELYNFNKSNSIFIGDNLLLKGLKKYIRNGEELVFIFNPNCKHCQLLIPKLSRLEQPVIGIYSESFSKHTMKDFSKDFNPQFPIFPVNDSIIAKLTKTYPLLITSKNGIIQKVSNDL